MNKNVRKGILAATPVVSVGLLSWLPFLIMGDRTKASGYGIASALFVVMLVSIPEGDGPLQALAGAYTIALIVSAVVLVLLTLSKDDVKGGNPFGTR